MIFFVSQEEIPRNIGIGTTFPFIRISFVDTIKIAKYTTKNTEVTGHLTKMNILTTCHKSVGAQKPHALQSEKSCV